jgi:hypothetical protein
LQDELVKDSDNMANIVGVHETQGLVDFKLHKVCQRPRTPCVRLVRATGAV